MARVRATQWDDEDLAVSRAGAEPEAAAGGQPRAELNLTGGELGQKVG